MFKSLAVGLVAGAVLMAGGVAQAAGEEELAKSSGCMNCHAVDTKKMGPAFKDIAAKYKGKADAQAKLVAEISAAKGHPAVKAKGDDLTKLVAWVLSM